MLKINESRKRSLLKAGSFRVIEVGVETAILSMFVALHEAVGLAILLESICFGLHFGFERIWNRIQYGRSIKEE